MSFRDLGIIELTVFAVLAAAFLLFFVLFVILRHRKRAANSRKLLRKQAMMEEAVQKKVRRVGEKPERIGMAPNYKMEMMPEEYETFAPQEGNKAQGMPGRDAQEAFGAEFAEETDFGGQVAHGAYSEQVYSGSRQGNFPGGENVYQTKDTMREQNAYQSKDSMREQNAYQPKDTMREENAYQSKDSIRGQNTCQQESLRMWDNNSKSMRIAKRSQQDPPLFVEERRISHRRDQLKRLEEAKQI